MLGTHQVTGLPLGGDAHIYQSLKRLLTTPKGARVMRRSYGCALHDLVGEPNHPTTWMLAQAAIAEAILEYEAKRVALHSIQVLGANADGGFHIAIEAQSRLTGEAIRFEELL